MDKITKNEVDRQEALDRKLDYISRQLGQLAIVQDLPQISIDSEPLRNRATDVLSATLSFLAVNIKAQSNRFGMIGKSLYFQPINIIRKGHKGTCQ